MFLNHKKTLNKILKHKGTTAIWGLSCDTKELLTKHPNVLKYLDYIIDNNQELQGQKYKNKEIVSFSKISKNEDLLIILLGNHTLSIVSQLQKEKFTNYLINYEYSKNYIPKDLIIELDYVYIDNVIKFCDEVIEYCKRNFLECHIKPYKYSHWPLDWTVKKLFNKTADVDINPSKKTLVFSHHTVGNAHPQILRWKVGYLYDTIIFDEIGFSGWSSLANYSENVFSLKVSKVKLEANLKKLRKKYLEKNISKYEQEEIAFKFPKEFIFFPLQFFNDTVMLKSNFQPLDLFKSIVGILDKKNIPLVVKRHPFCNISPLGKLLMKYEKEKKIILYNGSIHKAISKASTIYVINSGVGFESLMHLKPVVSFGRSDYMSVTRHIKDLKEIKVNPWYKLTNKDKEKIKLFLYYFINEKSINLSNKKDIEKKINSFIIKYLNEVYYKNK